VFVIENYVRECKIVAVCLELHDVLSCFCCTIFVILMSYFALNNFNQTIHKSYHCPSLFLGVFLQNCKKRLLAPPCLSVCPSARAKQLGSHWSNFDKIWNLCIFRNMSRKFKIHYNLTSIIFCLREDLCTFMIISRWMFLEMRNISNKSYREKQNTCFMYNNLFPKIVIFVR
jgi:hypothetical protein